MLKYFGFIFKLSHLINKYVRKNILTSIRILIYHDIPEGKRNTFEQQIIELRKTHNFITPKEFEDVMNGNISLSGSNLLLTFDDGFKSNKLVADQILSKYGIKAIFFVTSEFINCVDQEGSKIFIANNINKGSISPCDVPANQKPMNWEDLSSLVREGHVIGAHTKTHKDLSTVTSPNNLHDEIIKSANFIEEKLGIAINFFAYPFGTIDSISAEANEFVKEHFNFAFSGIRGSNNHKTNPLAMRRESISYDYSIGYLEFILLGGISSVYYFKRRKLDDMVNH